MVVEKYRRIPPVHWKKMQNHNLQVPKVSRGVLVPSPLHPLTASKQSAPQRQAMWQGLPYACHYCWVLAQSYTSKTCTPALLSCCPGYPEASSGPAKQWTEVAPLPPSWCVAIDFSMLATCPLLPTTVSNFSIQGGFFPLHFSLV